MTSLRKNTQKADADLASAAATLVDLSAAACPVSYPPSPLALPSYNDACNRTSKKVNYMGKGNANNT